MDLNLSEDPAIQEMDAVIREAVEARRRLDEDISERVRRKQAMQAVQAQDRKIEELREQRRMAIAKVRASEVARLKAEFDKLVPALREATVKAAELHRQLAGIHDEIGRASGGRNPIPRLHISALLPSGPRNATPMGMWTREIERYVESMPKPRKRSLRRVKAKKK